MKQKNKILIFLAMLIFSSCGHHRDVRPGVEGFHTVKVEAHDPEQGARDAIKQAQHFCEQRNMDAAFIKEDKKYTGDMDEKSYNNIIKASKVAQAVGGSLWVLGSNSGVQNVGGLVGLGGVAANIATGKGYNIEMRFKCI